MRSAGAAALALVLALVLAPVAGAHDETGDRGDVTHRDTPAELAGADISRALARAQLTSRTSAALPQYLPTTWCGTRRTDEDAVDDAFSPSIAHIKVVYAYPSDLTDRSAAWSDSLQADVSHIGEYLALQSGGRRALRFDMGTNCGTQYVDVQVVQLPHTQAEYLALANDDEFDAIRDDVHAALASPSGSRDVFVVADGLSTGDVYGIGEVYDDPNVGTDQPGSNNPHNFGGLTGIMFVEPTTNPNPSGWQPTVMLHEITHNLGGVQLSAPHSTSYAHCTDGEDLMCYRDGSPQQGSYTASVCPTAAGTISQTYDCGHNDYYNPDPGVGSYLATHWNVYNSVFMASCAQLGTGCGGDLVSTPPVNQGAPAVIGTPRRGTILTATLGSWLNVPSSYAIQWQRASNGAWTAIGGAVAPAYVAGPADVGAALRVTVTAANGDGAALAASAPTATVTDPTATIPAARPRTVHIQLRNGARHLAGTLTAKVRNVAAGREVSTPATKVSLPAGTWRLKLCAGRSGASPRCMTTARVRSRKRGVRLPAARVVVRTAGTLKVTASALDGKRRVRARGQAASD
ncbi:MAG: hypothetical protein V7607_6611 [Solirubrobacteraceae bacterium]